MGVIIPQVVTESRASGAQVVEGSTRFDSANEDYLTRTPAVTSDRKKWTVSFWTKLSLTDNSHKFFTTGTNSSNRVEFEIDSSQFLNFEAKDGGSTQGKLYSMRSFNDLSSWYHMVVSVDTTQATAANRIKIYVNGEQLTEYSTETYPSQNAELEWNLAQEQNIGKRTYSSSYLDGYMSQIYSIDGQQLDASYFGFTDELTNSWRPKKYENTTASHGDSAGVVGFGTGGFYLPFDGSAPIGKDESGQGNDFTPTNLRCSATIDKANGALPIYRTTSGGNRSCENVLGRVGVAVTVYDDGGGNKFYLDGVKTGSLSFARGQTVTFNLGDSTNSGHPFRFSATENGTHGGGSEYTDGRVTGAISPGTVGAATTITFPHTAPNTLYYYCSSHSGMGGSGTIGLSTDLTKADLYAWKNVLAVPMTGMTNISGGSVPDVSSLVNCVSQDKNPQRSGAQYMNKQEGGNYYSAAHSFNGSNAGLHCNNNSDCSFGSGDFTVEGWFNINQQSSQNGLVGVWAYGSNRRSFLVQTDNSSEGPLEFIVSKDGSNTQPAQMTFLSGGKCRLNRWNHFAGVRDGSTLRLFLNGTQVDSETGYSGSLYDNTDDSLWIGTVNSTTDFCNGFLQDIRIYKGVAKYTENFLPGSTDPAVVADSPSGRAFGTRPAPSVDTQSCGCVSFNKFSNYHRFDIADSADFDYGSGDFTLECWVMPIKVNNNVLLHAHTCGGNYGPCNLFFDSGQLVLYSSSNNSSFDVASGTGIGYPPVGCWSHVAVSRSGTAMRLFFNGKNTNTVTTSATLMDASSNFEIGYRNDSDWFLGHVCDFRVVKGTAVYKQDFAPPTKPLEAIENTVLLCCQNKYNVNQAVVTPNTITSDNCRPHPYNPYDTEVSVVQGPPANYAIFNDNDCGNNITLSNGGLNYSLTAQQMLVRTTMGLLYGGSPYDFKDKGCFYWEYTQYGEAPSGSYPVGGFTPGIVDESAAKDTDYIGESTYGYGLFFDSSSTTPYNNNSGGSALSAPINMGAGDTIMCAYNPDRGLLWYGINGIWYNGGSPDNSTNVTQEPTNVYGSVRPGAFFPGVGGGIAGAMRGTVNFGQKPFKYNPARSPLNLTVFPDFFHGYGVLNSTNAPTSVIANPSSVVGIASYTGNNSTQSISFGFKPDLLWLKNTSSTSPEMAWRNYDSVRGFSNALYSNTTDAEDANPDSQGDGEIGVTGDGFRIVTSGDGINGNTDQYTAWAWKAGGSNGTFNVDGVDVGSAAAAGLTGGDITPTACSINTELQFAIIRYTGNGNNNNTMKHGLADIPDYAQFKAYSTSSSWVNYTRARDGSLDYWMMNTSNATADSGATAPTSSLWYMYGNDVNGDGNTCVAYFWRNRPGYFQTGTYTGDETSEGPYIYTGFRPAMVWFKCTTDTGGMAIQDNQINPYNPNGAYIWPGASNPTETGGAVKTMFYGDGFQVISTSNSSAGNNKSPVLYTYFAWSAEALNNSYGSSGNAN